MPTDIQIAQSATLEPIVDIAAKLGLTESEIEPYGRNKAKVPLEVIRRRGEPRGKLVLVTGINPTPAGEGKSTLSVGLADALNLRGRNPVLCLREPSLGPVFGLKGGAAGGGYSQVVPMADINLHFTGDFHAITSAHALLSAMLDNHLHRPNTLQIDPRRIVWKRAVDMNDRALRHIVIGLGGINGGVPREDGFMITTASEIMAIFALATDLDDLKHRLGEIIVAYNKDREPVRARDLGAEGAMTLLLKDALAPNLVQTLGGTPAFVHAGPFGNIAHGCNSLIATRAGLTLGDIVVTEAGFGADLGAEKFFDIKCRTGGLRPDAAVVVGTIRALKLNGGVPLRELGREDVAALERGMENIVAHVENVRKFGVPPIVALNRFTSDTDAEIRTFVRAMEALGVPVAVADPWPAPYRSMYIPAAPSSRAGSMSLRHTSPTLATCPGSQRYWRMIPVRTSGIRAGLPASGITASRWSITWWALSQVSTPTRGALVTSTTAAPWARTSSRNAVSPSGGWVARWSRSCREAR